MIRRLRFKFVLLNMILAAAILIAALSCVYVFTAQSIKYQSIATMQKAANYFRLPDRFPVTTHTPKDNEADMQLESVFVIYVLEESDTYRVDGLKTHTEDRESYIDAIVRKVSASEESQGILSGQQLRYLSVPMPYGHKLVLLDMAQESASLRTLLIALIAAGLGAMGLFLLAGCFSSRIMVRPVEQSLTKQQQLVANISHELKTPVAVIEASADVIRSHRDEPVAQQEKWLDYITSETRRMAAMISDMLQLARTNEAPELATREVLDLSELAYGAALPFESLCYEHDRELDILVEPNLYIRANGNALRQVISILLDNACKYSGESGKIFFRVRGESEKVILTVRNNGTPIPPESLLRIFDRFYRVDPARTRSESSYGLGLAIAKKLTEDNGGKISVESSAEVGNTFTCTFRRVRPPEQ